ncbi:TadE/TadG family type IV pilus assembly protein [Nevskia soli]|uniref:TadE/TadG family type IV pilus assembly protein n=1 Tax=Nevskia soli TaxID=418856 RepID=UPI0009FE1B24|nr:TadE/TadG family type IV pilus assembly protein [Nevskia soli]
MNRFSGLRLTRPFSGQSGAAAVEFALVFPIMLAIVYGGIVYSYIYVLQQSLNFAAQQGAQAAVATIPITTGTDPAGATTAAKLANATLAVNNALGWLPPAQKGRLSIPSAAPGCVVPAGTFAVQVNFTTAGLFAALNLPGLPSFPYMPPALLACAVAYT